MISIRYVNEFKRDPRPKLFNYTAPGPVRTWALRLLEDRGDDDFLLRHCLRDAAAYGPRKRLLEDWKAEGHWGIDRLYMRSFGEAAARDRALVQAVKNLGYLYLFCWPETGKPAEEGETHDERFDAATELILARSQPDGFLQFISPECKWTEAAGAPHILRSDRWGGAAAAVLLKAGVEDERLEAFCLWLLRTQRPDGGWLPDYHALRYGSPGSLPSHPLHTTVFARALCAHPRCRASEAAKRAVEFLLDRVYRDTGPYRGAGADQWRRLASPQWRFDALAALALANEVGAVSGSERAREIVDRLRAAQDDKGLWRSRGEPDAPFPRADADLFLTLKVTATFRRYFELAGED